MFIKGVALSKKQAGYSSGKDCGSVAAIFCIPLIPYCWDTKYGSHILYPLKDQRGDTEYGRHTEYGVTPVRI